MRTYIKPIDDWFKHIEPIKNDNDYEIYSSFQKLEEELKLNHSDSKDYWNCYYNWFNDYDGIVCINYVDYEEDGKLKSYQIELSLT